nr:MAG TPA: adenine specific DNA methyltransferase [Caudoviricetes sp.]
MNAVKIVQKSVKDLIPYAKNAKKHSRTQIANVAESIKQYGFVQPVVIDRDDVIIIGHCRTLAAKQLGMKEIPCVCVEDLTPEQVKALRLVDNKSNESGWDMELLGKELKDLDLSAFDFEWGLQDELSDAVVEDDYDPVIPAEPQAKIGDVYQLGNHRLMCGDSTSLTDVQKLVGGVQMDLLLTDPPYNVDYQGTAGKIKNDNMEDGAFRQFLTDAFSNAAMVMKPGAAFYIWHADSEGYNFRGACRDAMLRVRQCLIWVKNALVLGRQDYQWKHEPCLYGELEIEEDPGDETEPCLYGWTEGKKHYFFKNRKQSTVLEFPKPKKSAEHPTMKPIKLFDYQMQCSTRPGECVLDLFAGSGTTIMACEQNGRNAYCMEFDPKFVDVIIDRWEKFTGKKAVLIRE